MSFFGLAFLIGLVFMLARERSRLAVGRNVHVLVALIMLPGAVTSRLLKPLIYSVPELEGGTFFFGWAIGSAGAILLYCSVRGIRSLPMLDALAPATLLASSVGRVGCYVAGCCGGHAGGANFKVPIELPWRITVPIQLLHSLGDLLALTFLLLVVEPRTRKPGVVFYWGIWLYSLSRAIVDSFRDEPPLIGVLTQGQFFGLLISVATLLVYWRERAVAVCEVRRAIRSGESRGSPLSHCDPRLELERQGRPIGLARFSLFCRTGRGLPSGSSRPDESSHRICRTTLTALRASEPVTLRAIARRAP